MSTTAFWQEQLEQAKTQLAAVYAAQNAILVDGVYSYSLDTGQGKTTVTKQTVGQLDALVNSLLNRITMISARINGDNAIIMAPGF